MNVPSPDTLGSAGEDTEESEAKGTMSFQSAQKFKSKYPIFGFSDEANLDKGAVWPTSFALKELTAAHEAKIGALVKKAVR